MKHFPRQAFTDAQSAFPFVVEQGRTLETRIYQKRYPTINYAGVIPVVTEGAEWAIGTMFQTLDTNGRAKIISGAANDLPLNSAVRDMGTHDYFMIGSGWEWNMEEINQAALYGIAIEPTKANTASQSVEQLLYDIAMNGTTEKNITGFVNDDTVSRVDAANTGTGPSRHWSTKDIDQVLVDINDNLEAVRTSTLEIEWADTIALPPSIIRLLGSRRVGTGDATLSWLDVVRKLNIYTAETGQALNIIGVRELETASALGAKRMVVYRRDVDVIRFHLPMPRRVLGVRQKSLMGFENGIIARTGGVEIRLPAAMVYVDEI